MPELGRRVVLLDGFPRSEAQLRIFETEVKLYKAGFHHGVCVNRNKQVAKPVLALLFNCPKEIAKKRFLTRNVEGRQTDDATLFERRYGEFERENQGIAREYRERELLIELDTSRRTEESLAELCNRLRNDSKWVNHSKYASRQH
jgi:adenylate kinase family enzyme